MSRKGLIETNRRAAGDERRTDVGVQCISRIEAQAILPPGCTIKDMGTFYSPCVLLNPVEADRSITIPSLLVDTGSDSTWIPSAFLEKLGIEPRRNKNFVLANGQITTRQIGYAIIRVEDSETIDEVVFGGAGDLPILGARALEGLNLTIDWVHRKLIDAGPPPAASAQ